MARLEDHVLQLLARVPGLKGWVKAQAEMRYWRGVWRREHGSLSNDHYERAFTEPFGLTRSFFTGRRILDIGCGPRGSLEWASEAAERVGLDPLVSAYRRLGIDEHDMSYVDAPSEAIPFPPDHFDVVSSFNSLDHVSNLDATLDEITRVTKAGGSLLLITDVNHAPTPAEPISFSWDVLEQLTERGWAIVDERRYEKMETSIYASLATAVPYDEGDTSERYGILVARLQRASAPI